MKNALKMILGTVFVGSSIQLCASAPDLKKAIADHNAQKVQELIGKGAEISGALLTYAIHVIDKTDGNRMVFKYQEGSREVIKALLDAGADPNYEEFGTSVLCVVYLAMANITHLMEAGDKAYLFQKLSEIALDIKNKGGKCDLTHFKIESVREEVQEAIRSIEAAVQKQPSDQLVADFFKHFNMLKELNEQFGKFNQLFSTLENKVEGLSILDKMEKAYKMSQNLFNQIKQQYSTAPQEEKDKIVKKIRTVFPGYSFGKFGSKKSEDEKILAGEFGSIERKLKEGRTQIADSITDWQSAFTYMFNKWLTCKDQLAQSRTRPQMPTPPAFLQNTYADLKKIAEDIRNAEQLPPGIETQIKLLDALLTANPDDEVAKKRREQLQREVQKQQIESVD